MRNGKRALGSDLARIDAHIIQPHEYEEIPELDDLFFERATLNEGGKLLRRGRRTNIQSKVQR